MTAEQELVRLAGAQFRGEFGGAAQQRDGGQEAGVGQARGALAAGAEAAVQDVVEGGREALGEVLVGDRGEFEPVGGPVVHEEQGAAGVQERDPGARGVPGELLPDTFTQRDLGELALLAQPGLDVGEGEGGAGLRPADGLGEVGVAAAPVADGGAADPREPGDPGRGHFCGVVLHPACSPRLPHDCDAEHTREHVSAPFTSVYTLDSVNRVDSVHKLCSY